MLLISVRYGLAAALLLAMLGCAAAQPAHERLPELNDPTPLSEATATLHVEGLSCPLCASNIDKQLLGVRGVQAVRVDLSTGQVRLTLAESDRPSRLTLANAVDQSGFTLRKIETP